MTSKISPTDLAQSLLEQEATANKRLSETQAEIAAMKAKLAALEIHHDEHTAIRKKVAWFAKENGVSYDVMMTKYALNRLLQMKEELLTLRELSA